LVWNICEGEVAKNVHKKVEEKINETQFKGRFIHSTGHSLGLCVHDGTARISANSELELKENMVFTIEPGIYLPGLGGIRIEDDIIIKKHGYELLTKSTKELIDII
jgi:Xaa-Pro dipeptidase